MSAAAPDPAAFAAALSELFAAIDWPLLGQLYCHEGGEDFFPPEQVEAIQDAGLRFAGDLDEALGRIQCSVRRSLYVGAALAELPVALCDQLMLGREVVLIARPSPETSELNRALALAAKRSGLALPRIRAAELGRRENQPTGAFDHLWIVSVLTDPEAFPALHDRLYQRHGKELATGTGNAGRERHWADRLVDQVLAPLHPPAILTTTDEELELVQAGLERAGLALELPERARLSAIVGDPVRMGRVRRPH